MRTREDFFAVRGLRKAYPRTDHRQRQNHQNWNQHTYASLRTIIHRCFPLDLSEPEQGDLVHVPSKNLLAVHHPKH
jgi:hypothetical protein